MLKGRRVYRCYSWFSYSYTQGSKGANADHNRLFKRRTDRVRWVSIYRGISLLLREAVRWWQAYLQADLCDDAKAHGWNFVKYYRHWQRKPYTAVCAAGQSTVFLHRKESVYCEKQHHFFACIQYVWVWYRQRNKYDFRLCVSLYGRYRWRCIGLWQGCAFLWICDRACRVWGKFSSQPGYVLSSAWKDGLSGLCDDV